MSKLEELINQLCPNGVEYVKIGDICKLSSGGDVPKENFSKEKTEEYNIPIYSNGIGENALYGYTNIEKVKAPCVTISARGTIGYCELREENFYPIIRLVCAVPKDGLNAKFLKYCIDITKFAVPTTGIPQLTVPMVSKYSIPLPPLPIQEEIVRILDNITSLTAELTAELKARQKQYEYYRDSLLRFNEDNAQDGVRWMKLGEVITFLNGRAYKQPELLADGKYKVVRVGNFYTNASWYYSNLELDESKYCNDGDLLFTWAATLGAHIWKGDKTIYHYHIWKLVFDEDILDKRYLYYFLNKDINDMRKSLTQSTMVHVSMSSMNERIIPIPSITEQRRIADLLDRFDKLCNDISEGLPAEIEARKKQYEYYRDKLLTFKEKEA